jgi:hypothetical protein
MKPLMDVIAILPALPMPLPTAFSGNRLGRNHHWQKGSQHSRALSSTGVTEDKLGEFYFQTIYKVINK